MSDYRHARDFVDNDGKLTTSQRNTKCMRLDFGVMIQLRVFFFFFTRQIFDFDRFSTDKRIKLINNISNSEYIKGN